MLIPFKKCLDVYKAVYSEPIVDLIHAGGNIGEELADYHQMGVERTLWFEPNPLSLPSLVSNCRSTLGSHVVMPCGLWHEDTSMELNIASNLQSSSVYQFDKHLSEHPSVSYVGSVRVEMRRFDGLATELSNRLPLFRPQFVNLDIQGSEYNALTGMALTIEKTVRMIYCEVNRMHLYSGIHLVTDIDNFLAPFGFFRLITVWTEHNWGDALYIKSTTLE